MITTLPAQSRRRYLEHKVRRRIQKFPVLKRKRSRRPATVVLQRIVRHSHGKIITKRKTVPTRLRQTRHRIQRSIGFSANKTVRTTRLHTSNHRRQSTQVRQSRPAHRQQWIIIKTGRFNGHIALGCGFFVRHDHHRLDLRTVKACDIG